MRRVLAGFATLFVLGALATPGFAARAPQPLPDTSQLDVFSAGAPRAFFVGSGGPVARELRSRVLAEDNQPPLGCAASRDLKCSQGSSQAHCIAYLNYYCDDCQCDKFVFP